MGLLQTKQAGLRNQMVYALPKGYIKVVNDKDGLKIETIYEPDEHHYYLLEYTPNIGFDDDITVKVTDKGFLESIEVTTKSQIPEIIKKIKEIAVEALKIPFKTTTIPHYEIMFDPNKLDEYTPDKFKETLKLLADLKDTAKPEARSAAQKKLSESGGTLYKHFNISHISLEHPKAGFLYTDYNQSASARPAGDNRGVCYRPALPFKLRLLASDLYIERVVYLPDYSRLVVFDINRPAFVEKIQSLNFTNGLLTQVHLKKDSELLAALGIPADLVKTVAGLPLELVKFQTGSREAEKGQLQAQIDQIRTEQELQKLIKAKENPKEASK
ncbi:MAG: hypothetical protein FJ126_01430 [Deltaproteobacteria bacterium]|nr:hypothetical protein [Deltaproteobacteria bacterium]